MDIYDYIRNDHCKVAHMIDELLNINLSAFQLTMFEKIRMELSIHAEAEEQTFYRALEEASRSAKVEDRVAHAREDHDEMRELMKFLMAESAGGPHWMEKFGELKHAIEHHVKEEETEIFAKARNLLSAEQAEQLMFDMEAFKQRIRVPENEPTN